MSDLLKAVILVSEKAASIARAVRQEDHLLSLLVQEKKDNEKNPRFLHDFKTLADVLVQEVVKHDLGSEFPDLIGHIYGEESNEFLCLDGQSVCLAVGKSEEETKDLLVKILGNERAAGSLTQLVHSNVNTSRHVDIPSYILPTCDAGIWIDPIDSTAEYIAGGSVDSVQEGLCCSGLPCVTVLIGAFHRQSGLPFLGVVNQPFHHMEQDRWKGKIVWGINDDVQRSCSIENMKLPREKKVVLVSSSESVDIKSRLENGGFTVIEAAGAGYKLLCVATGLASAYVLSKPSTFFWDTCAVQALLCAQGGGMVNYKLALSGVTKPLEVTRPDPDLGPAQCCNADGFIAYCDVNVLNCIVKLLQ